MEFWGVEVKPGQTVKCDPEDKYIHLSQASLGEGKKEKGGVSIPLFVNVDGQKLVIGTLSPEKCPQVSYDLVFEKEFELSHSWKDGSVFFVGYKTIIPDDEHDFSDTDSEGEEPLIPLQKANGKAAAEETKTLAKSVPKQNASVSKAKPAVEPVKAKEESDDDDEDDESDDDADDSEDEDEDKEMGESSDDEEDDDDESEEEKITPKKIESAKKRPIESNEKASVPDKKAKLSTPAKSAGQEGKKGGGHTATPHPAKQAAKGAGNDEKSKQQTPKSGGSFSCKSCSKGFNSDNALQSHTKAKHAAK